MTARGKERKFEELISALLSCSTVIEAAAVCRISSRTAQRWLRRPDFQKAHAEAKGKLLEAATAKLRAQAQAAVGTLAEISADTEAPSGSRVQAAFRILELSLRAHEIETLEERIKTLEGQANEF